MALFPQDRQIVIAGAGYAGLHAAAELAARLKGARRVRVTLVSEGPDFVDKCRLHERAVREVAICYPLAPLFESSPVDLAVGSIDRVDLGARTLHVKTPQHGYELPFDELFLAVGSRSDDWGVPGAREHALRLDRFADAEQLRRYLVGQGGRSMRLLVVGGGLTGVELAAELADWAGQGPKGRGLEITLVEAARRLVPGGRPDAARYCHQALERMGVTIRLGAQVRGVEAGRVRLAGGTTLEADRVLWCAGVRVCLPQGMEGFASTSSGRVPADAWLRPLRGPAPGGPFVLLGGDAAALLEEGQLEPLPPKALWAVEMGRQAGRILAARALGQEPPGPLAPSEPGELISLGRGDGCGWVARGRRRRFVSGLPAALLKDASLAHHLWELTATLGVAPTAY